MGFAGTRSSYLKEDDTAASLSVYESTVQYGIMLSLTFCARIQCCVIRETAATSDVRPVFITPEVSCVKQLFDAGDSAGLITTAAVALGDAVRDGLLAREREHGPSTKASKAAN